MRLTWAPQRNLAHCRLEPYRVQIVAVYGGRAGGSPAHLSRVGWRVRLYSGNRSWTEFSRKPPRTIRAAKEAAAFDWVRLRLDAVADAVKGGLPAERWHEFLVLYRDARKCGDPVAPLAMRDWLADNGFRPMIDEWILAVGRKAKVPWPPGWDVVAEVRR
jgi:hypothetical protein